MSSWDPSVNLGQATMMKYGMNALLRECMSDKAEADIVQRMLDFGADPNIRIERIQWTPLHYAVWQNHIEIARILLDNGADSMAKNTARETALDIAAKYGYRELHTLLAARDPGYAASKADQHRMNWGRVKN